MIDGFLNENERGKAEKPINPPFVPFILGTILHSSNEMKLISSKGIETRIILKITKLWSISENKPMINLMGFFISVIKIAAVFSSKIHEIGKFQ